MEVIPVPLNQLDAVSHASVLTEYSERQSNYSNENDSASSSSLVSPTLDSFLLSVPPTTPGPNFSFSHILQTAKHPFQKLTFLKIPYIREIGIKASIDFLSEHFSCNDYKTNPVQFWFLDIITDCIWKMQDEFEFPEEHQKVVTHWVLHILDLIRDPHNNYTRKEFFQIFNEAMIIAEERIQAGEKCLPEPEELFKIVMVDEEERSFAADTEPSSNAATVQTEKSYLAVGIDESVEVFELPKEVKYDENSQSSSDTVTQSNEISECGCEQSVEFYQPDLQIPLRFLSSPSSSSFESGDDEPEFIEPPKFTWKKTSDSPTNFIHNNSQVIYSNESNVNSQHEKTVREEWDNYLESRRELTETIEKNIKINRCALRAIKSFVYEYFQYGIVKLALMNEFSTVQQKVNTTWNIPKVLKEELKKPKPVKEKKDKKKKAKKPPKKKTKKDKKSKKSKKSKSAKGKKKDKKAKTKRPSKEEKARLAKLKREQERLEEELRLAEENRRMLFPLKDATSDDFFKSIFNNWVKPKEKKGKDKKKKKK